MGLKAMSIQELKSKLRREGISTCDCVEKDDLLLRLRNCEHYLIVEDVDQCDDASQDSAAESSACFRRPSSAGSAHRTTADHSMPPVQAGTPGLPAPNRRPLA